MGNYKASATAQSVAEVLALRTGLTASVDESGADPVITVGNATAGNRGFLVKVLDQRGGSDGGWDALPGFGTTPQPVYTGTVCQIAYEENAGGLFPDNLTVTDLLNSIGELVRRGARVELYIAAHTNPPAFTTFKAAFDPNLYYPLSGRV